MKKKLSLLTVLALGFVMAFGSICTLAKPKTGAAELKEVEELPFPESVEGEADEAGFVILDFDVPVSFHTERQKEVLNIGYKKVNKVCNGKTEYSIPRGIVITWKNDTLEDASYVISVGCSENLEDAVQYTVTEPANENGVYNYSVQNLYLGQTYYYNITANDSIVSATYSFTTDSTPPRNLFVEGVTNVRDVGGWTTMDGEVIKQGLLFRCGQFNTNETPDPCVTEAGIDTVLNTLGVKTEIDLRHDESTDNENGGIHASVLGESVAYYSIPMGEVDTLNEEPEKIKAFFDIVSDPANYPIAYHCKIGTDRTGAMTYLLFGLLGVSMDDIYTDFTFSNTGNIGSPRAIDRLDLVIENNFSVPGGESVQEACHNYLISIGVTEEQLQTIHDILIG